MNKKLLPEDLRSINPEVSKADLKPAKRGGICPTITAAAISGAFAGAFVTAMVVAPEKVVDMAVGAANDVLFIGSQIVPRTYTVLSNTALTYGVPVVDVAATIVVFGSVGLALLANAVRKAEGSSPKGKQ